MPHSTRRRIAVFSNAAGEEGGDAGAQARQFAGVIARHTLICSGVAATQLN